jgi:hypothetical protein
VQWRPVSRAREPGPFQVDSRAQAQSLFVLEYLR